MSTTTLAPPAPNVKAGQFCNDEEAGREIDIDGKRYRCERNVESMRFHWKEIVDVTTTTTQAPPVTEPEAPPTTIEPGGPDDPHGPILCPSLRHPAHHRPCPAKALPETASATPRTVPIRASAPAPAATGGSPALASIVECEDNDNPAAGPTGYASNTGNGYYGGGQWLPSTFRTALGQALAQGKITQAVYDANIGLRPDLVEPWVQDAAMAAHIAAGNRNAWPNC